MGKKTLSEVVYLSRSTLGVEEKKKREWNHFYGCDYLPAFFTPAPAPPPRLPPSPIIVYLRAAFETSHNSLLSFAEQFQAPNTVCCVTVPFQSSSHPFLQEALGSWRSGRCGERGRSSKPACLSLFFRGDLGVVPLQTCDPSFPLFLSYMLIVPLQQKQSYYHVN